MARPPPRKPDWLAPDYDQRAPQPAEPRRSASDNTARVLEFPSTARPPRRASRSSSEAAAPSSVAGALDGLRTSVLCPEPAYKSVLGRLAGMGLGSSGATGAQLDAQAMQQLKGAAVLGYKASGPAPTASQQSPAPAKPFSDASQAPQQQHPQQEQQQRDPQPMGLQAPAPALSQKPPAPFPDPALQQQLKERIERAKAEIKQQLSPLFRVSQALLSGQHAARAAQALEEVAGAADRGGLGMLAGRPGSSLLLDPLDSLAGRPAGAAEGLGGAAGSWRISRGLKATQPLPAGHQAAVRDNPLFEGSGTEATWEQPGSLLPEDVDSLVLSAHAAVSKAHATIVDLASPPRPVPSAAPPDHQGAPSAAENSAGGSAAESGPAGAAHGQVLHSHLRFEAGGGSDSSQQPQQPSLMPPEPGQADPALPEHMQRPLQPPPLPPQQPGALIGALPSALELAAAVQVPFGAPDLEGRIAQLRQRSELVIRSECDRLVAAMHEMYDEFLLSVQQHGLLVRVSVSGPASPGSSPTAAVAAAMPRKAWPEPTPQGPGGPPQAAAAVADAGMDGAAAAGGTLGGSGRSSSDCGRALEEGSSENVEPNAMSSLAVPPPGTFEFPRQRAGSPPEEGHSAGSGLPHGAQTAALAGGADGLGFGSPIRLVPGSQRPSLAKPRSIGGLTERPHRGAPFLSAGNVLSAATLTHSAGPAAAAATAAKGQLAQARPVAPSISPSPLHSPSYLSASSSLGGSSSPSPRGQQQQVASRPRQLGGGMTGINTNAGSSAAGTAHRRDLDSIVNSIRRLAAETRVKQGVLLPPPNSRLRQPAASRIKSAGIAGAPGPAIRSQQRLQTPQGSAAYSPTVFTATSRLASGGAGSVAGSTSRRHYAEL